MPKYLRRLWLLVGAMCLGAFSSYQGDASSVQANPSCATRLLSSENPATGELPPDQGKTYGVALQKGTYLHLVAEQHGADIVLDLFDATGTKLYRVDSLVGAEKPENVFLVAAQTGIYCLKVTDASKGRHKGKFALKIQELRRATDRDMQYSQAETDFYVAMSQKDAGLFNEAQEGYRRAIKGWKKLGDVSRQADAFFNLGLLQTQIHNWQDSLESFRRCHQLRVTIRDDIGRAESLLQLAIAEEKLGNLEEAERSYVQELQLRTRMGDRDRWISSLYNLARIQQNLSKAQQALGSYSQVIDSCSQESCKAVRINSLNGRGGIYLAMGRTDLALDDLRQALGLAEPTAYPNERASILTLVASIYANRGEYQRAMALTAEALNFRRKAHDLTGEGVTLSMIGAIYYRAQRFSDALGAFQRAAQIFEAEKDRGRHIAAIANIGVINAMQGRPEMALKIFNQVLPMARESGNKLAEAAILYGMAYAEQDEGNPIIANARIEEAIDATEDLRRETSRGDLRAAFLASREDMYAFKIELLMDQHALRPHSSNDFLAFQASERARARSLYESLTDRDEPRDSEETRALLALNQQQRTQINFLDLQSHRSDLTEKRKQELGARLRDLISRREETESRILAHRRNSAGIEAIPSPGLWEVQNLILDQDTLLLEYYMYRRRAFVWAATPTFFQGYELHCPELRTLARRSYQWLSRSGDRAQRIKNAPEDLDRLSNCLLRPVADILRHKLLVIVPHDELQKIPFSALSDPNPGVGAERPRRPLSSHHQIVQLPSVAVLGQLRKQRVSRAPAPVFLALLSDPVYGLDDDRVPRGLASDVQKRGVAHQPEPFDFQRLRFSREETRELRRLTRGRIVLEAQGFEANRDWVLRGNLASAQIVHIATHGVLNEDQPALSGLALSQYDRQGHQLDGLLRAHEIEDLGLKADLVVLSACQTGLGKDIRGEGLVGLTQGFLAGGASSLLVRLWKVDDRATAELMKRFYRALVADGLPPVASLRQAQIEMQQDKQWHDPYYWAGFVLQGEWRSRGVSKTSPQK